MRRSFLSCFLLILTLCFLVACGGGGGGASTSAGNLVPIANAGPAQTVLAGASVSLDATASADPEAAPLAYSWQLTTRPSTSTATLAGATSARPTFTADLPGSYALTLTVSDGVLSSLPVTVTVTALPTDTLQVIADKPEPVTGTVQLSLSGSTAAAPVTWYVDLAQIGTGATVAWNTALASNATHLVLARVQVSPTTTVDVRRSLTVANSSIRLTTSVSGTTGTIDVDVSATSAFGIASVSASFDGTALGTLTSPNGCSRLCSGNNDVYRFSVNAAQAGSGAHTMVVTAIDGTGGIQQASVAVPISNGPVLTLVAPVDGAIVRGNLQLNGTYTTDKPGLVTVTASLGDVQFLQSTAPSFTAGYDLSGVAPGTYVLTLRATDSSNQSTTLQRTVIVASGGAPVHVPVFSLGADGAMLAVEGSRLLYLAEDRSVRLRDVNAATEVRLLGPSVSVPSGWQLSGGWVYAFGNLGDCAANFVCVYQWQADGTRSNLSAGNPWAGTSFQQHPIARAGYVVWCNDERGDGGSYTLFEVATGAYRQIVRDPAVSRVGNTDYDFAVVGGVVNVFYWGQTGGASDGTDDVFRWASDAGTSSRLSTPGSRSIYPQTDGTRVAWSQAPTGALTGTTSLVTQPVAGGTSQVASSTVGSFLLRDGVLAWTESGANATTLKASTSLGTRTLSIASPVLLGAGGGAVVYAELGKTYSWTAATGTTLLLDAVPGQTLVSGSAMYFVLGSTKTVYRLDLR